MTALARMVIDADLLRDLLHLPDEVSVRGAEYDPDGNWMYLYLDGTPHPGQDVSPTFVKLVDWGVPATTTTTHHQETRP